MWEELEPPARAEHVSVYDARHHRLVVFGGIVDQAMRNDVWELSLSGRPRWLRITPEGDAPSPRVGAAAAYDPEGQRMIVFGGEDASHAHLNDLWELDLHDRPAWKQLMPAGELPEPRSRHTLTLDPENQCLVLIGGIREYWEYFGDVWRLSLSAPAWSKLVVSGVAPVPRASHSAVFCPELHGILLFGGESQELVGLPALRYMMTLNDTWLLETRGAPAWIDLNPRIVSAPCGLQAHTAVYDVPGRRMIVTGGGSFWFSYACYGIHPTFWSFSPTDLRWTQLVFDDETPRPRTYATAVVDAAARRVLLYGGEGDLGECDSDTWQLSLDPTLKWSPLAPSSASHTFPFFHTAIYDPVGDDIVAYDDAGTWSFSLRDGSGWVPLATLGETPASRLWHLAVYDSKRGRMIVIGGVHSTGGGPPWVQLLDDTWTLSLGERPEWTRLPAGGDPPPSYASTGIYDPIRDRLIVCGTDFRLPLRPSVGLWVLPLSGEPQVWREVVPSGPAPYRRMGASLIYDSRRDRLVMFGGGMGGGDSWGTYNDAWAFPLAGPPTWEMLSPVVPHGTPTRRAFGAAIYDPVEDRLVVFGGFTPGVFGDRPADDAWQLTFPSNQWSPVTSNGSPRPRWVAPTAIYDARRFRKVISQDDAVWVLRPERGHDGRVPSAKSFEAPAAEELSAASTRPAFSLGATRPNPSRAAFVADFSLPDAAPATLELIDLAGRRIWTRQVGMLGPGAHRISMAEGRHVVPGVYLVRLTHGRTALTRKVVHID